MAALAASVGNTEARDAAGNVLADGAPVVLVKELKVKGAGQTLKQGTVIKLIRLTDNPEGATADMTRSGVGVTHGV